MSASKKSGGSSQCCNPCDNCYKTNSKGTRISGKRPASTRKKKSGGGDCCNFNYGPPSGLHPGSGPNPPCFKAENGPDGVKLKNKPQLKADLKSKLKAECPDMSDAEADKMADDLINDIEARAQQAADDGSIPDQNINQGTGQSGPCNFTMCLDNYDVDPNTGTAEGDGPNDNVNACHNCNQSDPNNIGQQPQCTDPGIIQPDPF